ncbi:aminoglycoside phosphotransferase family protein [Bacillus carboniphilus]|uniref:Aminoglycoside phosphotransferase family protein n=1 Tax=Bacillus carboniphilus TaxID=86663 RepID=A0ABY9JRL4_9BACI|nr:aminoglycoside phosphotransferase family protein [Bacillus carboniphilus]WLR42051.1 aminoglycoside phosphotransferase family protein [Bacillus carboniphilus]
MDKLQHLINTFHLNVLTIDDVPESYSSTVYKIKLIDHRSVYLKIPYSKIKFERELAALKRFQHELPVPQVVDYFEGDEDFTGAILLAELNGKPLSEAVDKSLAYDIGVYHAKLHNIVPTEKDLNGPIPTIFHQWTDFLHDHFYSFAKDVIEVIDPDLYDQSVVFFESHLRSLPQPDGPSFIHNDFRPANIIIGENKVSGIIDFESVKIGSTEIDFTKMNRDIFMKYPGTKEAYQLGYESIRPIINLEDVLPFYRFLDAFSSIGWCKKRGIEKHRKFSQENLKILRSLLQ